MTASTNDGPLHDLIEPRPVLATEHVHSGMVWDVERDTVDLGEGGFARECQFRAIALTPPPDVFF